MGNKYGNKRTEHAGYSFASKAEAALYDLLRLREKAGEIKDIRNQVHVRLTAAAVTYVPDFAFWDIKENTYKYAEYKGFETDVFKIKLRLWRFYGPGPIEIWRGHYAKIFLAETVIPKIVTGDSN